MSIKRRQKVFKKKSPKVLKRLPPGIYVMDEQEALAFLLKTAIKDKRIVRTR